MTRSGLVEAFEVEQIQDKKRHNEDHNGKDGCHLSTPLVKAKHDRPLVYSGRFIQTKKPLSGKAQAIPATA